MESSQQDTNTLTNTPNAEKQEHSNRHKLTTYNNRTTTHQNHTEQSRTQYEEMDLENLNRTQSE